MLAVLVLESCIGGLELRIGFADGKPACAGVEPDVENVGFLAEILAAAVRAGGAGGQQSGDVGGVPGLDAFALEEVDDLAIERGVDDRLVALSSHRKTAMGTPQMRWRLMHQSGRVAIMLVMRSLPQAGSQTTLSISSMANWR